MGRIHSANHCEHQLHRRKGQCSWRTIFEAELLTASEFQNSFTNTHGSSVPVSDKQVPVSLHLTRIEATWRAGDLGVLLETGKTSPRSCGSPMCRHLFVPVSEMSSGTQSSRLLVWQQERQEPSCRLGGQGLRAVQRCVGASSCVAECCHGQLAETASSTRSPHHNAGLAQ